MTAGEARLELDGLGPGYTKRHRAVLSGGSAAAQPLRRLADRPSPGLVEAFGIEHHWANRLTPGSLAPAGAFSHPASGWRSLTAATPGRVLL
jgi:hypothetical protein